MRDGLAAGERLVNLMPEDRVDHDDRLRAGGIDVEEARKNRQLEVVASREAYLEKDGHFDGDGMLRKLPQLLKDSHDLGFALTRLIAHAEHLAHEPDDADAFMEYEAQLNYILPEYPDVVVCTYDLNRIGADVVMDVLRTHPLAVIGGVLQENPFFVPPDQFLREVRERRERRRDKRKKSLQKSRAGKQH